MKPAAQFILRTIFGTVLIIVLGTMAVFGVQIVEPMYFGFGEPPSSLGWGEPGLNALVFMSFGLIGLLLVIVLYMVFAPIQNDVRQEVR